MNSAIDLMRIIGNVFTETKRSITITSKEASAYKAATEVEDKLRSPGALGVSRVPEGSEEPLQVFSIMCDYYG